MASLTEKLRTILEPTIEDLGYELVHIEQAGTGKDRIFRFFIDAVGGIQVEDCETVSRQISLILDVEDPVQGAYTLEVSSPGLDRPLVKPGHFRQFIGNQARIVMSGHVLGRRRFTGQMIEATDTMVVLEVDGECYDLPYAQIESARLEPIF